MYHHTQTEDIGLGEAPAAKAYPQQNGLLGVLPPAARDQLGPTLRQIYLPFGSVLYEPGDRPHHIYFPTDCIVSLVHELHDGASAGIATIGKEGAVGIELFTGGGAATNRAVVSSPGFAYRLPAAQLEQQFLQHGELFHLLLRYTQTLITQMAQTAVCNRHHSVDQQLCRWLLMSLDRVSSNKLTMTQDLIANILGVRREGITVAAGRLQSLGIINYRRGQIAVLDRAGLEQRCCECYGVVRKETDRLLPRGESGWRARPGPAELGPPGGKMRPSTHCLHPERPLL